MRVRYQETTPLDLQRLVTQGQDALEPTVIELPMDEAISVSGMQPKLALVRVGQRYVHRTKTSKGVRVIAKLPVVGQPFMPRLEVTALALAHAAGVDVCEAKLELLSSIDALHDYNLPQEPEFLAVTRFDRAGAAHLHFEDFAQILGKEPSAKYTGSYLDMARVMMAVPGLGEPAVLELVRRIVVNELLGNPDGHLKNYGVLYAAGPNGLHASFAPAFDIVPYAISQGIQGHAMHLVPRGPSKPREGSRKQQLLTPATVREFAALAGMPEFKVRKAIETTCVLAVARWPAIIHSSGLPLPWVHKLLERLDNQPLIRSSIRPASKLRPAAWTAPV